MSNSISKNLAKAIAAASAAVKPVGKSSKNDYHGYSYASAEDMLLAAKKACEGAGLVTPMTHWEVEVIQPISEGGGGTGVVTCHFLVIHAESGESMPGSAEAPFFKQKGQSVDKAHAAAVTTCMSYFLRGLLSIPRVGEGEDIAGRDDREPEAKTEAKSEKKGRRPLRSDKEIATLCEHGAKYNYTPEHVLAASKRKYDKSPRELSKDELRELCQLMKDNPIEKQQEAA